MSTEYIEKEGVLDDPEGRVLDALADGMPYAFLVVTTLDPLNLRLATNHEAGIVRAMLTRTLEAMPDQRNGAGDG